MPGSIDVQGGQGLIDSFESDIAESTAAVLRRDWESALCHLKRAASVRPEDPRAEFLKGKLQLIFRLPEEALNTFSNLSQRWPSSVVVKTALVDCYLSMNLETKAYALLNALLSEYPDNAYVVAAAASLYELLADFDMAHLYYEQLAKINQNHESRTLAARNLLRLGHWKLGWEYFESRIHDGSLTYNSLGYPIWEGLNDTISPKISHQKSILVIAEQGLGDCLQFLRYLPPLEPHFDSIYLACHKEIRPLIKTKPKLKVLDLEWLEDLALRSKLQLSDMNIGCWAPLMSLPFLLRLYEPIKVNQSMIVEDALGMKAKPASKTELNVGYCFTVNPLNETESRPQTKRAMQKEACLSLCKNFLNGSLFGNADGAILRNLMESILPSGHLVFDKVKFVNLSLGGEEFHPADYLDSFKTLQTLDLVISVDTSIVHACGSSNTACVVLTPKCSDWRWGLNVQTSAWYPSVKILRYGQY